MSRSKQTIHIFHRCFKICLVHHINTKQTTVFDGRTLSHQHPINYVSVLFKGSQLNWAALTNEAYVIHMTVKKLSFPLADAIITLWSYHLHLKQYLQKPILNAKVNNWGVELSNYNIKFKFI